MIALRWVACCWPAAGRFYCRHCGALARRRWLWWTLLGAGGAAYAAAIGVHLTVGYLDRNHLMPAFAGLGLFGLGLALSYPLLVGCRSTQD